MKVTVYDTGHISSEIVCQAFADGCGAPIKQIADYDRGDDGAAFIYGVLRGGMRVFRDCQHWGRPFFFADNGYVRAGQYDGYYRITRDRRFHNGAGEPDYDRLDALGLKFKKWNKRGRDIIICPPVISYEQTWWFHGGIWLRHAHKIIKKRSSRPRIVRWRDDDVRVPPGQPPLAVHLENAWALVTHESNVAIEALLAGVPVFVTGEGAARTMAVSDLADIEHPMYPDNRREWLGVLAANQWILDEFRDGTAARALGIIEG